MLELFGVFKEIVGIWLWIVFVSFSLDHWHIMAFLSLNNIARRKSNENDIITVRLLIVPIQENQWKWSTFRSNANCLCLRTETGAHKWIVELQ